MPLSALFHTYPRALGPSHEAQSLPRVVPRGPRRSATQRTSGAKVEIFEFPASTLPLPLPSQRRRDHDSGWTTTATARKSSGLVPQPSYLLSVCNTLAFRLASLPPCLSTHALFPPQTNASPTSTPRRNTLTSALPDAHHPSPIPLLPPSPLPSNTTPCRQHTLTPSSHHAHINPATAKISHTTLL